MAGVTGIYTALYTRIINQITKGLKQMRERTLILLVSIIMALSAAIYTGSAISKTFNDINNNLNKLSDVIH